MLLIATEKFSLLTTDKDS